MNSVENSVGPSALERYRPQAAVKDEQLGKNAFLELMIAQLEHQDPLSPQENGEFISQLAQFSQVEGLDNLNTSVGGMASAMRSTVALQASTLVGRSVRVPTDAGLYDGRAALEGVAVLPAAATDLRVRISDASGREVRVMSYGTREAGNLPIAWDGRDADGAPLPAGRYSVKAEGNFGDGVAAAKVELLANVNSVSIAANGEVVLNVAGVGAVPMADVREVH